MTDHITDDFDLRNDEDTVGSSGSREEQDALRHFIEQYELSPELWNPTNPMYLKKSARNSALDLLIPFLVRIKPGANKREAVKKKINSLRTNYRKELKKIAASKRSGRSADEVYTPSSWVYFALSFLERFEKPVQQQPTEPAVEQILKTVHPYSEMTESEQAGVHGFKAQVFSEYGYSGAVEAVEYAKKAIELDPKQAEWHYLTGKIMGRIRRCANWNDYVKEEEIKLLEQALELCEKPSYMVYLASAYVDCTKSIHRNLNLDNEMKNKLHDMNTRAKELYIKCLQLNPDCPHLNIRCASGLLKFPRYITDMSVVEKCIKVALEKAPNNGFVNHVAGKFAEKYEYVNIQASV